MKARELFWKVTSRILVSIIMVALSLGCSSDSGSEGAPQNGNPDEGGGTIESPFELPMGPVNFTHSPVELSGVAAYEPMGDLRVLASNHGGFLHKDLGKTESAIQVFSPADGYIISIFNAEFPNDLDDYAITIAHNASISSFIGHVGSLSPRVLSEAGSVPKGTTKRFDDNPIPISAGEVLGTVSVGSATDFGIIDTSVASNLCNTTFLPEQDNFAVDIFNYFTGSVRDALLLINLRQTPPFGGRVGYCVSGSISGYWYLESISQFFDVSSHFTIGYDHLYPERVTISDGYSKEVQGHNFWSGWIKNNEPLPQSVTVASGMVKVELIPDRSFQKISSDEYALYDISTIDESPVEATYALQLLDENTLRVERFEGTTASEVSGFTTNARTYVRFP